MATPRRELLPAPASHRRKRCALSTEATCSGGTAAGVGARIAPLGVAEDTEGSIRVPASICGIFGFRPTTGRYHGGSRAHHAALRSDRALTPGARGPA